MSREHRNQALVLANNTTESRRIADTLSDNVVKVENPKWSYVKQEKYVCSTLRTQTHTHIRKIFYVRTMYPVVIHGECKYMENYTKLFWYSEEKCSFYYYEIDNDFRYFGLKHTQINCHEIVNFAHPAFWLHFPVHRWLISTQFIYHLIVHRHSG